MAQYPTQTATFTTKQTAETIEAAHINAVQAEITAITVGMLSGLAHGLIPDTTGAYSLGSLTLRWQHLFLTGNITAGGSVTAGSFVGDGAGLTNVSQVDDLNDLTDVTISSPQQGQVLQYVAAQSRWQNTNLEIEGGAAYLNDLLDVTLTTPGVDQVLTYNGSAWVNQAAQGVPIGAVTFTLDTTAPTGWIFFDGGTYSRASYPAFWTKYGSGGSGVLGNGDGSTTFTTPDASRRVPVGKAPSGAASTVGATGGAWDHVHSGPAHTHGVGTLTVASHNHAVGTLTVASHTHAVGTLGVDAHSHGPGSFAVASHTHGAGTLTVASHIHGVGSLATAQAGAHAHAAPAHTHDFTTNGPSSTVEIQGGPEAPVAVASDSHFHTGSTDSGGGGQTDSQGEHGHSLSGETGSAAPGLAGATAGATAAVTGEAQYVGATMSGATAATQPALSGNTGSVAPGLSGETASAGTGNTGTANQAYLVLNMMVKAI